MLYLAIGNGLVYLMSLFDSAGVLYYALCFDRVSILHGQLWRLVTFLIVPQVQGVYGGLILVLILFFLYRVGLLLEQTMGICKFNLFYLAGVVLLDVFGLLPLGLGVNSFSLNLSMILAFATLYPESRVLLFYFIPVKLKYLAWFYLGWTVVEIVLYRTFLPLVPLLNYALFFWEEIPGLLPVLKRVRMPKREKKEQPSPGWAKDYRSQSGQRPYHHKCTVCGRTDTDYPDLEFRYCSRCNGYYCYCMDHINNHVHIQ